MNNGVRMHLAQVAEPRIPSAHVEYQVALHGSYGRPVEINVRVELDSVPAVYFESIGGCSYTVEQVRQLARALFEIADALPFMCACGAPFEDHGTSAPHRRAPTTDAPTECNGFRAAPPFIVAREVEVEP